MKMKHKITLLVIGVLLVLSLMISSSYALWAFSVSQDTENIVVSDCFELTFSDKSSIGLEHSFPMKDSQGVQTPPYEFSVKNICNHAADFQIDLETLSTSTLDPSNIKIDLNGKVISYERADYAPTTLSDAISAIKLYEDTLAVNETKSYNLRMWLKDNAIQSEVENKIYNSKVSVKATVRRSYSEATLLNGIQFNRAIRLLSGEQEGEALQVNTIITAVKRSLIAPGEGTTTTNVATTNSANPVLAWFDNGVIYLYTEADKVYTNANALGTFASLGAVTEIDTSFLDTSRSTNMLGFFWSCESIEYLDVSHFDTSKNKDFSNFFSNCYKLKNIDISNFNTSSAITISSMFSDCYELEVIDVSHFNTSNVTDMQNMFNGCKKVKELDLSGFDTSKVTNMLGMFAHTENIESIDISSFNTSNVTNMFIMFEASGTKSLNLGDNFDTSKVTDLSWIFNGLNKITILDLGDKFDTSSATVMSGMFSNTSSLKKLDLGDKFDTSNATTLRQFLHKSGVEEIDLGNKFHTSNCEDFNSMFSYSKIKKIYVSEDFDISKASGNNLAAVFSNSNNIAGGAGTTYDSTKTSAKYARIDDPQNGKEGYFTLRSN